MTRPAIPWNRIKEEWQVREYSALRATVLGLDGHAGDDVVALLFATDPTEDEARRVLMDAFAEAGPDVKLALALYVYGRCLEKWEQTEDYKHIRTVLDVLHEAAFGADDTPNAHSQLLDIVVTQAKLVDVEMAVEDAMNCSCPVAMGARAKGVVSGLDGLLERERELQEGPAELRDLVRSDAVMTRRYFEAIADVSDAVVAFVERGKPGPAEFAAVLDALAEAERDVAGEADVYESELRAHRASLKALSESAGRSRLRVDAAEVVYLYPFALEGIDSETSVTMVLGGAVFDGLDGIGLRPRGTGELELNDLWDRRDVPEEPYSCASIKLPPITVETTAYEWLASDEHDDALVTFSAEVRLSRLGNHYVRVASPLRDGDLHDVNQALRRGSHGMGEEKLTSEGWGCPELRQWARFPEYADEVVEAIARALGRDVKCVRNLNATFHVVLAASSITLQHPNGSSEAATIDELKEAVGASLLFHPVRHLTTSLEEWIRYPHPVVTNLLGGQGYAGDLVVRTDNTTVTYMPASPEWLVDEYGEMIEFVASVPPLLTLWENKASQLGAELDEVLSGLERRIQADDDPIGELHEQETRIREMESDIRRQLAFLHSPALCRTRAQRRFLNELWDAAGLPALETELERRLTLLAERQERIAAMATSIDERHRQKQRERAERVERPVKILALFLTAFGIVGVFSWLEGAFDVEAPVWAWFELTALIAVTLLVGERLWRGRRSSS